MASGTAPTLIGYDVAVAAGIDTVTDPPVLEANDIVVDPRSTDDAIEDAMEDIMEAIDEAMVVID